MNADSCRAITCISGSGKTKCLPLPRAYIWSGSGFRRFCTLLAHLLHELAHRRNMTWRASFDPRLIALRSFFHVCQEQLVRESLTALRSNALDQFPYAEKFAVGFKKQIFVQKAVVQVRARLLTVTEYHHRERSVFRPGRCDTHSIIKRVHVVVLEEPFTCLPHFGFAPQIIDL